MEVKKLISDSFPPLKLTETVHRALQWMSILNVNQLPVIDGTIFKGLVSKSALSGQPDLNKEIATVPLDYSKAALIDSQHIYDALLFASNYQTEIIPVIDESGNYSGVVSIRDLINRLAEVKSLRTPGSIIVVETGRKTNPLSQLIEIIEANEGEVLTADIEHGTNDLYRATLKINRDDLSRIQAAFFRNNINVAAVYHHSDFADDLQQRFDSLMNYLNI